MAEGDNEEALRSKRTIGVLRQLFPQISQVSERHISHQDYSYQLKSNVIRNSRLAEFISRLCLISTECLAMHTQHSERESNLVGTALERPDSKLRRI